MLEEFQTVSGRLIFGSLHGPGPIDVPLRRCATPGPFRRVSPKNGQSWVGRASEGAGMIREQAIEEFSDRRKDPAFRNGWEDGRFGPRQSFLENQNLAGWASHQERLAYYRGHRDGRRVREEQASGDCA